MSSERHTREGTLRWLGSIALLLTVWMAANKDKVVVQATESAWQAVLAAVVSLVVLGFYLAVLWECISNKTLERRIPWLLFLIFAPIVSAFIYFMVTRSIQHESHGAR